MEIKVRIKWRYNDQAGEATATYGYDGFNPQSEEDIEGLIFWYKEGNGSCDCNRAQICGLPEMPCGDEIVFESIKPEIRGGVG